MNSDFFVRGVSEIIDRKSLEEKLKSGKKLRIKMGFDPTRPDLHLGHSVGLRKLKILQDMGHTVIFLVGDYTTKIGDPSGRNTTRPILSDEEIKKNAKTYMDQVGKILDVSKTELRYNSEWFSRMTFNEVLQLAGKFTVAQILERDDFTKRLKEGSSVGLHELLYPLMQAYDSVFLNADIAFCGADQKFNELAGRELQKKTGQIPQDIVMVELLVGLDGVQKMSKSLDNYIAIAESGEEQFGKIMSIPDSLIVGYFKLCTDLPVSAIDEIEKAMKAGANPRDYKEQLAHEIVSLYHGEAEADTAKGLFNQRFREKKFVGDIPHVKISGSRSLPLLLIEIGAAASNSEARRLIEQGGVKIDGAKVGDVNTVLTVRTGTVIQVGKRKIYQID